MNRHFVIKLPFIYALSLKIVAVQLLNATSAGALPISNKDQGRHNFSNGREVIIPPSGSWFNRRPTYEERQFTENAAQLQSMAAENAQKARELEQHKNLLKQASETNRKAVLLGKQGRWVEAIQNHEAAVQCDPRNKQYRINLSAARTAYGQQKLAQGKILEAVTLFRKALIAASENGLAGKLLNDAIRKSGIDPTSADARLQLGDQLAYANELEGALLEYQIALQLENSARAMVKMGDMAFRFGRADAATNWYRQAIVKESDYAPAHRQLGLLALNQRDYTTAAASLRKAVVLDSKDVAAGEALTDIWRKQVAANPLFAQNHLGLAGALQLTGDFAGAEGEYNTLERLDRNNPGLKAGRASLARAYQHSKAEKSKLAATTLFNQGLKREALTEIRGAVMLEPRNANYQFLLGECLEALGDYAGAHQAYLTCVLIDPENSQQAATRMKRMQTNEKNVVSPAPTQTTLVPQTPFAVSQAQMAFRVPESNVGAERQEMAGRNQMSAIPNRSAVGLFLNDNLEKVANAEMQRDYTGAIAILRQLSMTNMQNPEIHHRFAVNLMAAGQITEAVTEFRIASALNPAKKEYSDDLTRALVVHKRSLMSDAELSASQQTGDNKGNNR